jgi:hypothetical protein
MLCCVSLWIIKWVALYWVKWRNVPEASTPPPPPATPLLRTSHLACMYLFNCSQLYCLKQIQSDRAERNNETNAAYVDSDLLVALLFCVCILHKTQPCFIISMLLSTSDRVHSVCIWVYLYITGQRWKYISFHYSVCVPFETPWPISHYAVSDLLSFLGEDVKENGTHGR